MEISAITPAKPKTLLIIDGHAYAYRAFYAIRQLTSPVGAPTNAIYGFIRMLNKMRSSLKPSHLAAIWDGGLSSERTKLLASYKTHRPEMPPALDSQMDGIARFLEAGRVASFVREGIEADDLIATLTKSAVENGFFVIIASSDKDFMQLVSSSVGLLNPNDKTERIWTVEDVRAKTGVAPEQIVDLLSLIGDTVDNIPGVPGIGALRAADLLQRFGDIDSLYQRVSEVSSARIRVALQAAEPDVRRNQSLIRLHCDLPDRIDLQSLAVAEGENHKLLELYQECGFKTLAAELQKPMQQAGLL